MGDPWQVLATCPHCRVEAAVVQIMDPAHPATHLGRPAEQRCRCCGWEAVAVEEGFVPKLPPSSGRCPNCSKPLSEAARTGRGICGECGYTPRLREISPPANLRRPDAVRAALIRWAEAEGEDDVERFAVAHLGGSVAHVDALIQRGEVVHTSFDVIAWLFPDQGGGALHTPDQAPSARPVEVVDRAPAVVEAEDVDLHLPEPLDPRVPARVLISVMAADGEIRPGERRFIDSFLEAEGLPPVDDADLRVWRPHELIAPPDFQTRRRLIEACVHLVHLDHERDGTEWKVVRAFAGAWGVSEADVEGWDRDYDARYATTMTRLWRTLSGFVRLR